MLDSRQISEWMAYYAIEPFGQHPEYYRTGILGSIIANVFRGKHSKTFRPEDFMPKEPQASRPKHQSIEEQRSILQSIAGWAKKQLPGSGDKEKK